MPSRFVGVVSSNPGVKSQGYLLTDRPEGGKTHWEDEQHQTHRRPQTADRRPVDRGPWMSGRKGAVAEDTRTWCGGGGVWRIWDTHAPYHQQCISPKSKITLMTVHDLGAWAGRGHRHTHDPPF
jgi:hypothetical protein